MNNKLSYIEGWLSIFINMILFVLKLLIGLFTNSIAIIADAWHTLSDSITSIIVIIGAKVSSKPEDKEHPFGHGRIEFIASIIIGVILFIVGFNFLFESVKKLTVSESITFHPLIIVIFSISVLLKEGIAQFSFWAFKKTKNISLKADGWHHRSDAIASLLILIGVFFGQYFWWIDGVLGIIVSVLIGLTAISIIKEAANPLIGKKLDNKIKKHIEKIVYTFLPKESKPHHFHYHNYGNHKELSFHIYLNGHMQIDEGHKIADTIEQKIKDLLNIETTIHIETIV
jgi:cation diffusion facilitator family transporter